MALPSPSERSLVVITGASAGIGAELARQLADLGHHLALVARRRERLDELAGALRAEHGVEVLVLPCDLSDREARRQLAADIAATGREVIGLCNNAGFGTFGRFHELDLEHEAAMVELNVAALHELTGTFLPGMVERGSGAILNVGSVAGYQPIPGNATYAATKAFVQSFSEAVHAEVRSKGVSVTTLNPGPVPTEFGETAGVGEAESKLPGFMTVDAESVAAAAVHGMVRGKRTVVPGTVTKALGLGGRFSPRSVLLPVAAKATDSRLLRPKKPR
jgi:short-subunit dehydrogenase